MLHIVFNPSAASGLRDALRQVGRNDRVICLFDDLSFGPISPPDSELRWKWVEEELGYTDWEEIVGEATSFWAEACSVTHRKVAWLSRRSAQEYSGFLEWLWRVGEEPIQVVDLTDTRVLGSQNGEAHRYLAISLACLHPNQIIENDLLASAKIWTPAVHAQYRQLWERLRTENARLRILTQGKLVSAPICYFDPLLLSHVTAQYQKATLIIAKALTAFWDSTYIQTGDLVLAARLRALANAGAIESQGDLFQLRHSEVRLPARH